ncbi:MAG: TlpA disulfide reductase family protein [Kofleriaceae bacterium]|nr:TlpA disulfide reductase family protein [Kofleriaceae bacterium]
MQVLLYLLRSGLALALAIAAACGSGSAAHEQPAARWYRAVVSSGTTQVPFLVELPTRANGKAHFRSGSYAFEADATVAGDIVRVEMPIYNSVLVAASTAEGIAGTFQLYTPFDGNISLKLSAKPVAGPDLVNLRDEAPRGKALDLGSSAYFRVEFDSKVAGKLSLSRVGEGAYDAELLLENGSVSYLGGVGDGNRLVLSGFDGTAAFQLDITFLAGFQEGRGTWHAGQKLDWHERVTLRKTPDFEIQMNIEVTELAMPELAPFAGKPLLVEFGASWCSTCREVAPALHEIYDQFHAQGLEVVTVLYEFSNDAAYDRQQAEKFKRAYNVPWVVMPITSEPGEKLPAGVGASAFPLLVVVGRDGKATAVRAGFPMDVNSTAYRSATAQLRSSVEAVVKH